MKASRVESEETRVHLQDAHKRASRSPPCKNSFMRRSQFDMLPYLAGLGTIPSTSMIAKIRRS